MAKFDGVIEAVHYQDGRIASVRAFERRGAAFSDRVILSRDQLIERLKGGRKFVTGKRKEFYAGSFDTGSSIQLLAQNGGELITTRSGASRDELEGVPLF